MQDKALLLGIESSCDETAASVLLRRETGEVEILSSIIASQDAEHAPFGGVVPEIARTADEIGCLLAISFHATTDEVRDKLVPINKRWNIEELLTALAAYPKVSNSERITFEYVMLNGVNDSVEDAHRLVDHIKRHEIAAKINLIPFNEWPGAPYKRSSNNRIHAFADIIHEAGYASPIRRPRGEDIMAACGQLKSATERARKSRKQIEAEAGMGS